MRNRTETGCLRSFPTNIKIFILVWFFHNLTKKKQIELTALYKFQEDFVARTIHSTPG